MTAAPQNIKTMQLYRKVERIHNELRARGIKDDEALRVEDLVALDQYHYHGTAAVDAAISALAVGPDSRVFDVGAGIGGPARYMAFKTGCRVAALELQSDLDRTAAGLTERCGLGGRVTHFCGDILSGMMDGAGFDALVSMLVFLHIPDRASLLSRCHDALKPGGALFVEDYYQRGPLSAAERRALAEKVYCRYLPDFAAYEAQLRDAGFTAVELEDQTESWAGFVAGRLAGFRADRDRLIAVHGQDLFDALDDFYATVDGLFAGGNLGGVRIVARRA